MSKYDFDYKEALYKLNKKYPSLTRDDLDDLEIKPPWKYKTDMEKAKIKFKNIAIPFTIICIILGIIIHPYAFIFIILNIITFMCTIIWNS